MNFGRTNKVKGIAISKKFITNISNVLKNYLKLLYTSLAHYGRHFWIFTYILQ